MKSAHEPLHAENPFGHVAWTPVSGVVMASGMFMFESSDEHPTTQPAVAPAARQVRMSDKRIEFMVVFQLEEQNVS